ncbi:hypothetical protein [Heliophilum fasciatum]|uniref:Uncharacterized protein n=1 Tax=Heliophilum fasciatum TaxID=35700 RepID=A0A4V2SW21_9FIRM|nr:hypothetical protein [Heliophilum fasciatum]MCW2279254.1 hypothetical protein [Heliophilum fasciatum]TCP60616.1 hypothetical protein EDD73_1354 [Heliophilum fasciatum]
MTKENRENINALAAKFAATNDQYILTKLYYAVQPYIQREAKRQSAKSMIPKEDYESIFGEEVWNAALQYNGKSHFMQRLHTRTHSKAIDINRYHLFTEKRSLWKVNSLDSVTSEDGTPAMDRIPAPVSVEQEVITKLSIDEFQQKNPKEGVIIKLLACGFSNLEIAKALGKAGYGSKERKDFFHSRRKFKEHFDARA